MVLSLPTLLALGAANVGSLSNRVAVVAAIPRGRHSGPWSVSPDLGGSNASCALAERTVSRVRNLKLKLLTRCH